MVESVNLVRLQTNRNREIRSQVLVHVRSMAKGGQAELRPFNVDLVRHVFGSFPFVNVGLKDSLADLPSPFCKLKVAVFVVGRVPVLKMS